MDIRTDTHSPEDRTPADHSASGAAVSLDTGLLSVDLDHSATLNLAMACNAVPVVSALRVNNLAGCALDDLRVSLELRPGVSEPWIARISNLAADASYNLPSVDLVLNMERLAGTGEREPVQIWVEVQVAGEPQLRQCSTVDLLAFNEWNGLSGLPHLLAAFVQPNHPAVTQVLQLAREVLERQMADPSLSGYQRQDPQYVRSVVEALYQAIQQLGVSYINPPASFQRTGQKVRTPDQVLTQSMGTCLDLSVLMAACLEQVGLHPWLVLVEGHAFVGAWLTEDQASTAWTDDGVQLLKLVELAGAMVLDASTMVARPHVPMARAEAVARAYLDDAEQFICAICVKAARAEHILPLPSRIEAGTYSVVEAAPEQPRAPAPVAAPAAAPPIPVIAADRPAPPGSERLARWKERLLDLSLRNRLLNFRETKKTIPLDCPDLPRLEDALALGRSFTILPRPELLDGADPRDPALLDARTGQDAVQTYLEEQLHQQRLHSSLAPQELEKRQLEIARAARLSLEESGVSTLYLALGFLRWYEAPQSEQARIAPLVLLPVELIRSTARDPFRLARVDDEARANITLLEKLRIDFGIELPELADELPMDDAGVDMPAVLRLFQEAVLNMPRWYVEHLSFLGHFSFTKFLMWRDLDDGADALLRSPVVRHLTGAADRQLGERQEFPDPGRLDQDHHPANTFCPLDADSTQLSAVFAAEGGRTFVLEGPPGTGKSQTIANLISQCLATGKTVLFVSEKMAALEVVHRRLERVGLGEFCLELHSNKARKRDVLERLGRSWDAMSAQSPAQWALQADKLAQIRWQLNSYVDALHRLRESGETVFEVTSRLVGLRDAHRVPLNLGPVDSFTPQQRDALFDTAARLQAAAVPIGAVAQHPMRAVALTGWQPGVQEKLNDLVGRFAQATETLRHAATDCAKVLQSDAYPMCVAELQEHHDMANLVLNSPGPPEGLLEESGWSGNKAEVEGWIQHGRQRDAVRLRLDSRYDTGGLLALDVARLHRRFSRWAGAFFLLAFFMLLFARLSLRKLVKPGTRLPVNREVGDDLSAALYLMQEEETLRQVDGAARRRLGGHWTADQGPERWDRLHHLVSWVDAFRRVLGAFVARRDGAPVGSGQRGRLLMLAGEESPARNQGSPVRHALQAYVAAYDAFMRTKNELVTAARLDEAIAWGGPEEPAHLDHVTQFASSWRQGAGALRDWCHFMRVRGEAVEAGIAPLMQAHADGQVAAEEITRAMDRSYSQWWLEHVSAQDPVLREFHSAEHQRLIDAFVEADTSLGQLCMQETRARLAARLPDPGSGAAAQSDMGVLLRELQKKTRHMPLRKLFSRIPALLRLLKPCLLMSPLSVAQYLGTDYSPFDLVVFDEASQIPTHDAIGAIGRGEQAVVVGDTKQLPPTSFFARVADDTTPDESDIEELESILDECLAAGLPRLRLGWHYRSRHESLIAFSNYHYYDNALHTFPAAESSRQRLGVSLSPVPEGHYDKGRSRTNRAEAEAVVAEVMRRLGDPLLRRRSLGVVTFSMAQQRLIEELLDAQRREHPEIEPYFSSGALEPLFIKNLENVQGDERDVMLFSICYGPDKTGTVSMNFGPLNRTGGERRLNVAVTRARYQLVVFSTLTADQIDLSRTQSEGARNLKTFLDYARRGPAAIAEATVPGAAGEFDSPLERLVHQGLQARGWQAHPQVGCSGYRIDLGVVDPERPGRYLLGVECDGAYYHSARCARDRDRLRELVLNSLGWRLHRIWSTDFWHDPERELDKVEQALHLARAETAPGERDGAWAEVPPGNVPDEHAPTLPKQQQSNNRQPLFASGSNIAAAVGKASARPPGDPYPAIPAPTPMGGAESFYSPMHNDSVTREILEVVHREAPIHLRLLTRRVLAAFDASRVTKRAVKRMNDLLGKTGALCRGDMVWAAGQDPDTYDSFRRAGEQPEQQRKAAEIAPEEAAAAILWVLRQNIALPMEDLAREAGRLLGFARTGQQINALISEGVEVLVRRERCQVHGERVELSKK